LDRIDLHIEVNPVTFEKLSATEMGESSEVIRLRVSKSRDIQRKRYTNSSGKTLYFLTKQEIQVLSSSKNKNFRVYCLTTGKLC
jgi:predicted ATPase with chaperone activity